LIQLRGAAGLRTVPVGNSAAVKAGEPVLALGNAEGQGTIIPAAGQVTALSQARITGEAPDVRGASVNGQPAGSPASLTSPARCES
jgi:serine protease Do